MHKYILTREALGFLRNIPAKHARQIINTIERLAENHTNVPSKQLEWFPALRRAKSGEYRIIYRMNADILSILILRIWKRNDGQVYKRLENLYSKDISSEHS